jgi:hypothetical protein
MFYNSNSQEGIRKTTLFAWRLLSVEYKTTLIIFVEAMLTSMLNR